MDEKVKGAGARARVEGVDDFEAPVEQQRVGQEQLIRCRDVARSSASKEGVTESGDAREEEGERV